MTHVNQSPFIYEPLWNPYEEYFAIECFREMNSDLAGLCGDIAASRNDISHFGTGLSSSKAKVLSSSELSATLESLIARVNALSRR